MLRISPLPDGVGCRAILAWSRSCRRQAGRDVQQTGDVAAGGGAGPVAGRVDNSPDDVLAGAGLEGSVGRNLTKVQVGCGDDAGPGLAARLTGLVAKVRRRDAQLDTKNKKNV